MPKTEFIRARVDERLKVNTEVLFNQLGLTMTEAITLFLKQCELRQGLPFDVKMPNEETRQALAEAHAGVGIISHENIEAMFSGWDNA